MRLFTCSASRRMSKPPRCAASVGADAAQHADGGRLARAVRPQEPEHRAAGDLQVDVVDRDETLEDARQALTSTASDVMRQPAEHWRVPADVRQEDVLE